MPPFVRWLLLFALNPKPLSLQCEGGLPFLRMHFLFLLWLSQYPTLLETEEGNQQIVAAALALTHDSGRVLAPYERSLLNMVAQQEMTVSHMLAYLREQEQA